MLQKYKKHSHSSFTFFLLATKGMKELDNFIKKYEHKNKLSLHEQDELYKIICDRMKRLQAHPSRDYWHKPFKITNQIFLHLILKLNRIPKFHLNKMLPPCFDREKNEYNHSYLKHLSLTHINMDNIKWDDIFISTMDKNENEPAIYDIHDLRQNYSDHNGKIIRHYMPNCSDEKQPSFSTNKQKNFFGKDQDSKNLFKTRNKCIAAPY